MKGYVYRLLPPRPGFAFDMSPEERAAMTEHAAYWSRLTAAGKVLAYGPVNDPAGPYGIGIVLAETEAEALAMRDADPAVTAPFGIRAEIAPMLRLLTPNATYEDG
jgi:uncharacterized protein YciI